MARRARAARHRCRQGISRHRAVADRRLRAAQGRALPRRAQAELLRPRKRRYRLRFPARGAARGGTGDADTHAQSDGFPQPRLRAPGAREAGDGDRRRSPRPRRHRARPRDDQEAARSNFELAVAASLTAPQSGRANGPPPCRERGRLPFKFRQRRRRPCGDEAPRRRDRSRRASVPRSPAREPR